METESEYTKYIDLRSNILISVHLLESKSYFCAATVLRKSCFSSTQSDNYSGSDEKPHCHTSKMIGF